MHSEARLDPHPPFSFPIPPPLTILAKLVSANGQRWLPPELGRKISAHQRLSARQRCTVQHATSPIYIQYIYTLDLRQRMQGVTEVGTHKLWGPAARTFSEA